MVGPTIHDPLRLKKHQSPAGFHINSSHGTAFPGHGQPVPLRYTELQEFSRAVVQTQAKMEKNLSEDVFILKHPKMSDVSCAVQLQHFLLLVHSSKARKMGRGGDNHKMPEQCWLCKRREMGWRQGFLQDSGTAYIPCFALLVLLMSSIQHPAFANCLLH